MRLYLNAEYQTSFNSLFNNQSWRNFQKCFDFQHQSSETGTIVVYWTSLTWPTQFLTLNLSLANKSLLWIPTFKIKDWLQISDQHVQHLFKLNYQLEQKCNMFLCNFSWHTSMSNLSLHFLFIPVVCCLTQREDLPQQNTIRPNIALYCIHTLEDTLWSHPLHWQTSLNANIHTHTYPHVLAL